MNSPPFTSVLSSTISSSKFFSSTMDPRNSSPLFSERPIVLTPPPLEQHTIAANLKTALGGLLQLQPELNQNPSYHGDRQQSVGYNLQHEFETLTADLDLDLTQNQIPSTAAPAPIKPLAPVASPATAKGLTGPGLLAPSATKYNFMDLNSTLSPNLQSLSTITDHPVPSLSLNSNGGGLNSGSFLPSLTKSIPSRPQSVNDFLNFFGREQQRQLVLERQEQLANNFYTDLLNYSNWIENLSPQDTITMIEYLCNNLPLDILLTFKSKLDSHLIHRQQPQPYQVVSPFQQPQVSHDYVHDLENLHLDHPDSSGGLYQPKPKPGNFRHHLFADVQAQRPKSADPSLHSKYNQKSPPQQPLPHGYHHGQKELDRARSPTSHLYEKTSFLQLAAGSKNSPTNGATANGIQQSHSANSNQPAGPAHMSHSSSNISGGSNNNRNNPGHLDESLDINALKLGALATINSRVALDSSRKNHGGGYYHATPPPQQQQQQQQQQSQHPGKNAHYLNTTYAESINRAFNSSSVPVTNSKHLQLASPLANLKTTPSKKSDSGSSLNQSLPSSTTSSMPPETSNIELLKNIPAWLKLLRLHKYTDCLKDIYWKDLIELNDAQLEEKGVKALGARRKLLKAFDAVKAANP